MLNYESNIFGIEITDNAGKIVAFGLYITEPDHPHKGNYDLIDRMGASGIHIDYFKSLEALKYRALSIYLESRE